MPRDVMQTILKQVERPGGASTGELARRLGMTRQAVHRRLRELASQGKVRLEGAGRGSRWVTTRAPVARFRFGVAGLAEDRVWDQVARAVPALAALEGEARRAFAYPFMELVNNAIEHSGSPVVQIAVAARDGRVAFEVIDTGVGALARIRDGLGLAGTLDALQELSKGKVTTMPESHTGEGIFFSSKLADRFELEANGLVWVVDNLVGDFTVRPAPERSGTRVRFEASIPPRRTTVQVFDEYTREYEFARTRTMVRLFAIGTEFVSRSQARRLLHGLERFREVIVDFTGLDAVGQGFCDEVFRVWARAHPDTLLVPANMAPTVELMVKRALATP